jgi:tripartite-type tricarboxylate transporter receptor subunit TctC
MKIPARAIVAAALAAFAPAGFAQGGAAFPTKPITFVVTSPPGGSNDIFARAIGKKLADAFGKPVVVENRPGATGSIGEALVAKSEPDGHTIVMISSSYATKAAVHQNLPYDPLTAFVAVAMIGRGPLVLAVAPTVPASTPQEFFALARKEGAALNYATSGPGSINHFATELLNQAAGLKLTHIPYKGMGPATADLIGGHVQVLVASVPSVYQHVKAGKVKGIGVTTARRSAVVPELPPLADFGAKGYDVELWWGVLAPAGTPKDVVAKLNAEINKALSTDEMKQFLVHEGAVPSPMTPEAFDRLLHEDIERWRKVGRDAGIKME